MTRVQVTDAGGGDPDGPTWLLANAILKAEWLNPGGDWRDRNDVPQGSAHWALSAEIPSYGERDITLDVTALIRKLQGDNTGIYLRMAKGSIKIAAKPRLTINGVDAPCLVDTWLSESSGNKPLGDWAKLSFPVLLKFAIPPSGAVTTAILTLHVTDVYTTPEPPYQVCANFLDTPSLDLVGTVENGIAASVAANDLDLKRHPSVLVYNEMSSHDEIWNGQWSIIAPRTAPGHVSGDWTLDPQYVAWPEYGLTAGRVTIMGNPDQTSMAGTVMHHWVTPKNNPPWPWQRDQGAGHDEMYCRYLLSVDPDVSKGMRSDSGVKLPGMAGVYGVDNSGQYPAGRSAWSYRMEHFNPSPAHPGVFRLFIYAYDWTNPISTGSGKPLLSKQAVCLFVGRKYCIEQYVKMNTQAADGSWNSDGIIRVWVNGIRIVDITDRMIRKDAKVQIQSIPFLNFYHGGVKAPNEDIHYQVAGVVAATKYIGPPKLLSTPPLPPAGDPMPFDVNIDVKAGLTYQVTVGGQVPPADPQIAALQAQVATLTTQNAAKDTKIAAQDAWITAAIADATAAKARDAAVVEGDSILNRPRP